MNFSVKFMNFAVKFMNFNPPPGPAGGAKSDTIKFMNFSYTAIKFMNFS